MGRMKAVFPSVFLHVFLRRLYKVVYYFSIGGSPHPWALHGTSFSLLTFSFQLLDFSLLESYFYIIVSAFIALFFARISNLFYFLMCWVVILCGFHKFSISSLPYSQSPFCCLSLMGLCFLVCSVIFDSKSFTLLGILSVEIFKA